MRYISLLILFCVFAQGCDDRDAEYDRQEKQRWANTPTYPDDISTKFMKENIDVEYVFMDLDKERKFKTFVQLADVCFVESNIECKLYYKYADGEGCWGDYDLNIYKPSAERYNRSIKRIRYAVDGQMFVRYILDYNYEDKKLNFKDLVDGVNYSLITDSSVEIAALPATMTPESRLLLDEHMKQVDKMNGEIKAWVDRLPIQHKKQFVK